MNTDDTGHKVRTMADEQAEALQEEFPEFHVWVDFRPMQDGDLHWHARQTDWKPVDYLNARDAEGMRNELIIWRRENPTEDQTPHCQNHIEFRSDCSDCVSQRYLA